MKPGSKYEKLRRKLTGIVLDRIQDSPLQFRLFPAWWHQRLSNSDNSLRADASRQHYIAQQPNSGAGIGHQIANWNSGLYFSNLFKLQFAHFPFSSGNWESFLGFGAGEVPAASLLNDRSYRKVRLPRFDSDKQEQVDLIEKIIRSYRDKKVLFLLAQDQGYMRQCDTSKLLSKKFFNAPARSQDQLFFPSDAFTIAIHIRRGDIAVAGNKAHAAFEERWLNNDYYVKILREALSVLPAEENIQLYLFSQGKKEDFQEFNEFKNLHFCLDVNALNSFLHLVNADLLISSKSSFSYKPALISTGIKICPANFWHAYPSTAAYVLADDEAQFDKNKLRTALETKNNLRLKPQLGNGSN